ncbi:hypothetical protein HanIR_Chr15g0730521 [Helianthus annuus]|nr:hypothetical protein HanIR_Chr15g0730521 [Helianthus annuus]
MREGAAIQEGRQIGEGVRGVFTEEGERRCGATLIFNQSNFFFFLNKKTISLRGVHPVRFWTRGKL